METKYVGFGLIAAAAYLAFYAPPDTPQPAPPAPNVAPAPCPPAPKPPRRPWADPASPVGDDEPMVDLMAVPREHRPNNVGGSDGSGLCVFTSIQYASWYQNEPKLKDFQKHMRSEPGGGYPSKVDKMIEKYGKDCKYIQYEGKDPSVLELILKTGRVPCITWQANHMLNCVALNEKQGAIVDNNAPDKVQWFPRASFVSKWTQGGGGWAVCLLASPPAPPPRSFGATSEETKRLAEVEIERLKKLGASEDSRQMKVARKQLEVATQQMLDAFSNGMEYSPSGDPKWTLNGLPANKKSVIEALIEDDSTKLHFTVIGSEGDRAKVLADLAAAPELLKRVVTQSYAPDAWETKVGFVVTGSPTIYIQDRGGRVLYRSDKYTGPSQLVSALRKADPNYQPANDPGMKPGLTGFDFSKIPPLAWVLAAIGLYLLLKDKP